MGIAEAEGAARVGSGPEGLEFPEHCRDELRNGRVNVHRALNDRIGRLGVHGVKDRVNNLITASP